MSDICTGVNDGAPASRSAATEWVSDAYNGATLTILVADSCGDANAAPPTPKSPTPPTPPT